MNTKFCRAAFLSVLAAGSIAFSAQAQDMDAALQALDDALPGELLHNPLNLEWSPGGNDIKSKMVDADELTSGQAVSIRVKKRQSRPWDSYLRVELQEGLKKGEEIQVYYYVRTAKAAKGMETAKITMYVGRNEEPYDYIISEDMLPGTEWALASVTGIADADYPAGEIKVEYQLGKATQTVEFGPVYVSTLGLK